MTRAEIRERANEIVRTYSATMRVRNDATIRKGSYKHLDPSIPETVGWWVDCQVFVEKEEAC